MTPEPTATDQYQLLRAIWPKWRALAMSSGTTDRLRAEAAVERLYRFYGYPTPPINWLDSMHRIPVDYIGTPIFFHFRESLIHSVWHWLREPAWVCAQIGYNPHDGSFQLPLNKQLLMTRATITPRRRGRRPAWMVSTANMISQFDVDALAIQQLAGAIGVPPSAGMQDLTAIVCEIAQSCFTIIAFEESCLLIAKPSKVMLNEAQQLSAQGEAAFRSCEKNTISEFEVYSTNGRIISVNEEPDTSYSGLMQMIAPQRVALIEYMGWEAFLRMMTSRCALVHRDQFGSLYLIRIASSMSGSTQEFLVVEVKNKTAEPNGRYRRYAIPVDRECRPLPNPSDPRGRLGAPQSLTALNAVASTFGLTGSEYVKILGRES